MKRCAVFLLVYRYLIVHYPDISRRFNNFMLVFVLSFMISLALGVK